MNYPMKIQHIIIGWIFFSIISANLVTSQEQGVIGSSLVIDAPTSVLEDENFQVLVKDNQSNPVEDAMVTDGWSGTYEYTNNQGLVTLTAPSVDEDTNFSFMASKEGYQSDTAWIIVLADGSGQIPESMTLTAPYSVLERQLFEIKVFSSGGSPVDNVAITVGWTGQISYTNIEGTLILSAPEVSKDTHYTIEARKEGYLSDEAQILIRNQEPTTIQLLTPNGGENWSGTQDIEWTLNVSANNYSIIIEYRFGQTGEWETIVILENLTTTYAWDTTTVNDGFPYWIQVSLLKESELIGVDESDDPFTISNAARIIGEIADGSEQPIEGVQVCITETSAISRCTFTNEEGTYELIVPTGTYTIEVRKIGYEPIDSVVTVIENTITTYDFTLSITIEDTINTQEDENTLAEYALDTMTQVGLVGARVTLGDTSQVDFYSDRYSLEIVSRTSEETIFLIGAEANTPGTSFIFTIPTTDISIDAIMVRYDDTLINEVSISTFLYQPQASENPIYAVIETGDSLAIIVYAPSFSQHTITISSVIETIGGLTALMLYLVFCIVVVAAAAFHMKILWRR